MSLSVIGSGTVGSMTLGVYPRRLQFFVASVTNNDPLIRDYGRREITALVQNDWELTQQLGQPSLLRLNAVDDLALLKAGVIWMTLTPPDNTTSVSDEAFGEALFVGNVLETQTQVRGVAQRVTQQLSCQDLTWQLNGVTQPTGPTFSVPRALVTGTYGSVGFNTVVGQLLHQYCPTFTPGYIPQGLGNAPQLTFDNVPLLEALQRFTEAADGYLSITPDAHVHVFRAADHVSAISTITVTSRNLYDLRVYEDLTGVVENVIVTGEGTVLTTQANSTRIFVQDIRPFLPAGTVPTAGLVLQQNERVQVGNHVYDRQAVGVVDATTGEGYVDLTAVPDTAFPAGTVVKLAGYGSNAQGQVLTRDSRGRIRRYGESATNLNQAELNVRAFTLASRLGEGFKEISFASDDERHVLARQLTVGQQVYVSVTSPIALTINSPALTIQQITITPKGTVANSTVDIRRQVQAAQMLRTQTLDETLAQTRRA